MILTFSPPYADGGRAVWATTAGIFEVLKIDHQTGELIDEIRPSTPDGSAATGSQGPTSGVYSMLDRAGRLIVGRGSAIEIYGDSIPGDRRSPIAQLHRFQLPAAVLCRPNDRLVGIGMLWDGTVAFATQLGMVGTVPRVPGRMDEAHLRVASLNGADCANPELEDADLETVSNSIAVDERGGIYVVTSEAQHKLRWDGRRLERGWRTPYETGGGEAGARVGAGSGATPSLLGTGPKQDRFVSITDGRDLMHLVLIWRNRIPEDWRPIAPGKPRRIACEVPVTFGDPEATASVSEQSVLVRGYANVVVNNALTIDQAVGAVPPTVRPVAGGLAGQVPGNAPQGLERIDWNPRTRTCSSRWANREVSIPNGIPAMSTRTGLVYGIGQRGGTWGLEALDFASGESRFFEQLTPAPTENTFFAAATIGPDGDLYSGTFGGVTILRGAG